MNARSGTPPIASQPQYALLAHSLMDDIASGRYPVGSLLPTELDLCTQFGVSRHTVREAIRRLQDRGLVTRQRGIGTTVKASRTESRYVQSTTTISDLPRYVEDTRLVVHATEDVIANATLAETLRCPAGQRWVKLTGFRFAGRQKLPIALTTIYINAAYGGIRRMVGTTKVPVYTLLEKHYGVRIGEVAQEIRACTLDAEDAKRLSVKSGSAGLVITRRYLGDGDRPVEVAVNLHPADRFSYSMTMRLHVPAGADA